MLEGSEVMYLDRVEAAAPLRVAFQKGSRVPAHASASGKMFLATMQPAKRDRMIGTLSLERYTNNTLADVDALKAELSQIKGDGYAFDDEEFLTGLFCVAVPIFDRNGRDCLAALALQAPVVRLSRVNAAERLPILREAAEALALTFR